MSDEAIRLQLSQDKLHRALAKGPGNYRAVAAAELQVRNSERALRGETDSLTRSQDRLGRELSQTGRGALLGTGAFRRLGRSVAFASASFLGGAGLVYGMRQAINVASNLEEQQNKVNVTFRDSGQEVIEWSKSTSTSIGIARDQALAYTATIGGILNVSGLARDESSKLSRELVQLAADMASFNNASPEETLEALRSGLVGESEPLRRYQVLLSAARVEQEAYASGIAKSGEKLTEQQKVLARYRLILKDTADQQGDFARTSDGLANSQRTLSALWRDAQGLVGQALAPAYTDVVQSLRDWLAVEENQVQLQKTVNALVGDAEEIVRGFASGLKFAKDAASPLIGAMGGLENAVRAVTLLWLGFKIKAVASFVATSVASRVAAVRMAADAAVAGRAWDVATRPRVMSIGVVGTGAFPGAGGAAGRAGRGGRLARGALGLVGLTPGGAIAIGAVTATYFGIRSGQADAVDAGEFQKLMQAARSGKLTGAILEEGRQFLTDDQYRRLRQVILNRSRRQSDQQAPPRGEGRPTAPRRGTRGGRGDFTLEDIETAQERSEERLLDTDSDARRARILREELRVVRRGLRELELTRDERVQLKQRRNAIFDELARIEQEAEQEAADRADKRRAARQRAQQREKEQRARRHDLLLERIAANEERLENRLLAAQRNEQIANDRRALRDLIRFHRARERDDRLTEAEQREHHRKRLEAQNRLAELNRKARENAKRKAEQARKDAAQGGMGTYPRDFTRAEIAALEQADPRIASLVQERRRMQQESWMEPIRRMQFEFLQSLQGLMNQFGSNLLPPGFGDSMGQMGTHTREQTVIQRQMVEEIRRLTQGTRHPYTGYAHTELAAAFEVGVL